MRARLGCRARGGLAVERFGNPFSARWRRAHRLGAIHWALSLADHSFPDCAHSAGASPGVSGKNRHFPSCAPRLISYWRWRRSALSPRPSSAGAWHVAVDIRGRWSRNTCGAEYSLPLFAGCAGRCTSASPASVWIGFFLWFGNHRRGASCPGRVIVAASSRKAKIISLNTCQMSCAIGWGFRPKTKVRRQRPALRSLRCAWNPCSQHTAPPATDRTNENRICASIVTKA